MDTVMNIWHDIDERRVTSARFDAVVEIPYGCKIKYELDKETGFLRLDRVLYTSTHYPANYGFIPRTLAQDGDPLDVLVLSDESLTPLSLVSCRPIGVIRMIDESERDDKIIAIANGDPNYKDYKGIGDLPQHIFDEMSHFFSVYKKLEGKHTSEQSLEDEPTACAIIQEAIKRYRKNFCVK